MGVLEHDQEEEQEFYENSDEDDDDVSVETVSKPVYKMDPDHR